jgi:hypothetical protein
MLLIFQLTREESSGSKIPAFWIASLWLKLLFKLSLLMEQSHQAKELLLFL